MQYFTNTLECSYKQSHMNIHGDSTLQPLFIQKRSEKVYLFTPVDKLMFHLSNN